MDITDTDIKTDKAWDYLNDSNKDDDNKLNVKKYLINKYKLNKTIVNALPIDSSKKKNLKIKILKSDPSIFF